MTTEELRIALNISEDDSDQDDKIEALYALSKKTFTQYTRVDLEESERIETLMYFEGSVFYLNYTPCEAITSINSTSILNGSTTAITDYLLVNNTIYFSNAISVVSLTLVYDAGYSIIPTEIDQILVKIISYWWKSDDQKTMISSSGEMLLEPNQIVLPKIIRDAMAIYRVGI